MQILYISATCYWPSSNSFILYIRENYIRTRHQLYRSYIQCSNLSKLVIIFCQVLTSYTHTHTHIFVMHLSLQFLLSHFIHILHSFYHLIFSTCLLLCIKIYLQLLIVCFYCSWLSSCMLFLHVCVTTCLENVLSTSVSHYIVITYQPSSH